MRHVRYMPAHEVRAAAERAERDARRLEIPAADVRRMADRAEDRAAERAGTATRLSLKQPQGSAGTDGRKAG
jgi:hypothetical protein